TLHSRALRWLQSQESLCRPPLHIAGGPPGRTGKRQDAPVSSSVLPQSAGQRSKRHRALGTRHGVRFATTPLLLGWTKPCIILIAHPAIYHEKAPFAAVPARGSNGVCRSLWIARAWRRCHHVCDPL